MCACIKPITVPKNNKGEGVKGKELGHVLCSVGVVSREQNRDVTVVH